MNNTKKFAINALILTVTSFIMSSASMSFTVYITGKVGASGIGLYQLIMTVYRLSVTFATGGIGLASTRLVSEEMAKNSRKGALKAVKSCLLYALFMSVCAGTAIFMLSEYIASSWLCDMRTLPSLRILAFSLPALSLSSVMCGYFTAMRRVVKNSAVILFEQYVKISLSVYFLGFVSPDGLESACCALVLSATSAEILSFIILGILYLLDSKKHCKVPKSDTSLPQGITRRMLSIALPVALTSYLRSGLSSIEQMMIPWGLKRYGHSENAALAQYGVIGGMAMPVIMFPAVFISSFSGLLVTEISALRAVGAKERINTVFSYIFRFTMLFSIAVASVLMVFGGEIAMAMYDNESAALFIRLLAPLVCVMYLDSVTDSMLKGLNQQQSHMRYNIIDSAVSVVLTVTLLPLLGISGYIIVITVSETLNFFLSFRRLVKVTGFKVHFYDEIVKPAVAAALSVLIMRILYRFMYSCTGLVICIVLSAVMYAVLLKILECVKKDDLDFVKNKMR